jgi:hypothetical protein
VTALQEARDSRSCERERHPQGFNVHEEHILHGHSREQKSATGYEYSLFFCREISVGPTYFTKLSLVPLYPPQSQILSYLGLINLLKPTGYVMYHQFNIQQFYICPHRIYVLYLPQNKQRLLPHTT